MAIKGYSSLLGKTVSRMLDNDEMTVKRTASILEDGIVIGSKPQEIYTDLPCHLSFSKRDASVDSNEDFLQQYTNAIVFCSSAIDIKKGDKIMIKCENYAVYEGVAGEPTRYKGRASFSLDEYKIK